MTNGRVAVNKGSKRSEMNGSGVFALALNDEFP